ncbi:unnamed protein product [Plutella xylostella]|uniref:(diamondback moth) hypothetical protein n=1 Tax=Plutella xylostella TaxID=51655 RepID=A0A8S4GF36_PLUXY|nr:unnamed protein product [Plutella xylostella]
MSGTTGGFPASVPLILAPDGTLQTVKSESRRGRGRGRGATTPNSLGFVGAAAAAAAAAEVAVKYFIPRTFVTSRGLRCDFINARWLADPCRERIRATSGPA